MALGGKFGMGMLPSVFAVIVWPLAHDTVMGSGNSVTFNNLIFPFEQWNDAPKSMTMEFCK
eukprot:3932488-Ditylum_brightwellii.AAC.1